MYPPVTTLTRVCTKNYVIPDTNILVEKGTVLTIPIQAMQLDSEFFEDPKEFNPDRFGDEKLLHKNQFVYMPFGEGPRQCIGNIEFILEK
jgi:cytochrome P450 family 6